MGSIANTHIILRQSFPLTKKLFYHVRSLDINLTYGLRRFANTVGLVIEKRREEGVHDALQWYCENTSCRNLLYEESFAVRVPPTSTDPLILVYFTIFD
jgi:3-hydroxyanthranilate 3,4-dioxygenase